MAIRAVIVLAIALGLAQTAVGLTQRIAQGLMQIAVLAQAELALAIAQGTIQERALEPAAITAQLTPQARKPPTAKQPLRKTASNTKCTL